jgi:hypothetical protein
MIGDVRTDLNAVKMEVAVATILHVTYDLPGLWLLHNVRIIQNILVRKTDFVPKKKIFVGLR